MVSGVSFRAGALDSARDILDQPQKHSKPAGAQTAPEAKADEYVKPKKKHTVRNVIIGSLVAAAAVVGGLVAGHKLGGFNKIIEKVGTDATGFKKFLGQAAEKANTAGEWITAKGVKAFEAVKGLFKKGGEGAGAEGAGAAS